MEFWAIVIGIIVVMWSVGKLCGYLQQKLIAKAENIKNREREIKEAEEELEKIRMQNERDRQAIEETKKDLELRRIRDMRLLETIAEEKSQGFPWLAEAYADYFYLKDLKRASYLEHKSHPARKAAEQVKEIAERRRIAEKLNRVLKYQLEYYENLFPWLVEFKSEDIDDLIIQILDKEKKGRDPEEPDDPVKR